MTIMWSFRNGVHIFDLRKRSFPRSGCGFVFRVSHLNTLI
ncbi:hypothetical protein LINPERHAP2_LOCUS33609 [Linum perenne]